MKKLKDFFYDNNDILIAFLILVAAAAIILWRMNAIIDYPKDYVGAEADSDAPAAEQPSGEATEPEDYTGADEPADTEGNGQDRPADTEGSDGSSTAALWANGVLTRSVEVRVSGDTAAAALQTLIDAGLFTDYAEYQQVCTDAGLDHQKVSAGTFTFQKGASKKDVAAAINWG